MSIRDVTVQPGDAVSVTCLFDMLASRIHAWAQRKRFYDPCSTCRGKPSTLPTDEPCPKCHSIGSDINMERLERMLLHINGEVNEIFQLTRDHPLDAILRHIDGETYAVPDKHVSYLRAIEVEAADIIIRVLDMCGWLSLDIGTAMVKKLEVNDDRPIRHGRLH